MNRQQLTTKLSTVTTELLRDKGYISFVEVFMKLGYLDQADYEDWRRMRISHLERVIKVNLSKINFIMRAVRKNSLNGGLRPSWTGYKSWGKGRKTLLRFFEVRTGDDREEICHAFRWREKEDRRSKVFTQRPLTPSDAKQDVLRRKI